MTLAALLIGGVWLFAVLPSALGRQVIQRPYPTLQACEQAKAELLRRFPDAFALCDAGR